MGKRVDISGLKEKIKIAQNTADIILPRLIEDAATHILSKLVEETLNGMSGTDYPKPYPSSVSEGQEGYVGVITSNLRRSIGIEKVAKFQIVIRQTLRSIAPYHDDIILWSKLKYGLNFYEIAISIYGKGVEKRIFKTIERLVKNIDNNRKTRYRNPF